MNFILIFDLLYNTAVPPLNEWDSFKHPETCVGVFIFHEGPYLSWEQIQRVGPF